MTGIYCIYCLEAGYLRCGRFFMRCVVEGQSPYDSDEEGDEAEEEKKGQAKPGVVYRLAKRQLKVLNEGIGQYEAMVS